VFKDRELRKAKSVADWKKEEWLKKSMMETIQQIHKTRPKQKGHPHPWKDGKQLGWVW
jgi:hypothetical protein